MATSSILPFAQRQGCAATRKGREGTDEETHSFRCGRRVRPRAHPACRRVERRCGKGEQGRARTRAHDLATPLSEREAKLRQKGLEMKLKGKVAKDADVVKLGPHDYIELEREATDRIFVVIAEFGELAHAAYPVIPEAGGGALRRAAAQRDPEAEPRRRQHDLVAGGLQQDPLREHVLQPDGRVLRDAVLGPLLGRR